jgi:multicomponent K+:H+ antiporter subunit E
MSRLLPHPLLTLVLLLIWLMLTRFSLGHVLLGGAIAILASQALASLHPEGPRLRRWDKIARLAGVVFADILRSNAAVASLILTHGRHGRRRSGFLDVPLDLRDRNGLAWLAVIITATPGTAWIEYDAGSDMLLIHVFDLVDEDGWRFLIKNRYESLLLEIFE